MTPLRLFLASALRRASVRTSSVGLGWALAVAAVLVVPEGPAS